MRAWLLDLLVCPECRTALRLESAQQDGDAVTTGRLACQAGHVFPITNGIPRFVAHELNADQARTRDSFGDEWTRLYPAHGHSTPEWQAERDIFLEYTRSLPSEYRGKLALDAGCGNGRYAKLANDWGARVVCVDISSAVEIAQQNVGGRPDVTVVQADLFKLPFRPAIFDIVYSIGVLHHTPDAEGAFHAIQPLVKPGGFFSIFMHGQGNRALYAMNRWLRAWTSKASYRTTWNFCLVLTGIAKLLLKIPFVGPVLYIAGRQVLFFSPDQHNNYDHYSAGFTSFHRKEEIRGWYAGWDDVAVRYQGVAAESIYARGARPFTS
ncbi:MAG TPA: methyltransferase domain-containing protein [Vicinamibacterales bacterium]|nr:methyltransferase domain-containing protein [Vicinamibacterales bacterium]